MNPNNIKIGILGGGQLGRMIIQETINYDLSIAILDPNEDCSSAQICGKFVRGDFNNYDDVLSFGKELDVVTIEIEHVNTDALYALEKSGVKVYPQPSVIELIKDKGSQKEFYKNNQIPTAKFEFLNKEELAKKTFPLVAKTKRGGYDGKGVKVVLGVDDLKSDFFDNDFFIEEKVNFVKELSVIVARSASGEVKTYETVEQEFNHEANLVEFLFSPAQISKEVDQKCQEIAKKIIVALDMVGLLAVELFLTENGEVLVNEIAPRPHNSGHHTIEACETSQFEQHMRSILNWPLGNTNQSRVGLMVNLLGEKKSQGPVSYNGFERLIQKKNIFVHLYGKKETKPFRKMGHATIIAKDLASAREEALWVKETLKVESYG